MGVKTRLHSMVQGLQHPQMPAFVAGLSLAWLATAALLAPDSIQGVVPLPGQIGLGFAAWSLMRSRFFMHGCVPLAWLSLMLLQRILLALHAVHPTSLTWSVAAALLSLAICGLALLQFAEEIWLHRPWRRVRERLGLWIFSICALVGLLIDVPLLVMPLLARPVLSWLRGDLLRRWLPAYALALVVCLGWSWSHELAFHMQGDASQGFSVNISGDLSGTPLVLLGPLHIIAMAWLHMQLPATLLIMVGRLLNQSRIRTKLVMNALFSSVLPLGLLILFFGTLALVVMGSYRARLVRAQFEERLESGRLVTAWFSQAFADPLDRAAQRRFEQQLRTMGGESHMGRGFFCLYWSADTPGGSVDPGEPDSLRAEHWRRLVATWRMPSDFPLEEIALPPDWRQSQTTGLIRVGNHAYQIALIEQNNLLSAGIFPIDEEALEEIGQTLGTGIRMVAVQGEENLVRFGLRQIGLRPEAGEIELALTTGFPGPLSGFTERLFQVGLTVLNDPAFPLNTAGERVLVQVEALPGRILPAVFMDEKTVVFPYLILLLLQLLVLLPLLITGIWIAWMLNWRITKSIDELKHGTDELARGNLDIQLPEQTGDELGQLAHSFNDMSRRIRGTIDQMAATERMERELSIARTIQEGLLPGKPPCHPRLDIASTCRMAHEVGGDYYDFRESHQGKLSIALGDVSGKGVAAALLMSNLQASWRSLLEQELDPGHMNSRLNNQLAESTADDIFVTFIQGQFRPDGDGMRFNYSNAGHNPPILVRNGGLKHLDQGGLALGMFDGASYQTDDLDLKPGDWLVFYTDGLTEAQNKDEEEFGQHRLEEALLKARPGTAKETLDQLLQVVGRFEAGAPRIDDQTLLVLKVNKPGAPPA